VEGILGGRTNTLSSGSAVHANELIRSGDEAVANLVFIDQTKLSVGPKSEVRLDKFVYDPNKNTGTVVVRATKGAYRFVTGVQDPRNYEIKTPYATLGVRGTILEVNLEGVGRQTRAAAADDLGDAEPPQGDEDPTAVRRSRRSDGACRNWVKIKLVEGAFHARTISGQRTSVTEPNTVLTVCSDGSFQTTQVTESILNFSPETAFAFDPGILVAAGLAAGAIIIGSEDDQESVSPH
jgi:hypothetical protein